MPLMYSAVARGSAILAECAAFGGNFTAVAKDYLAKAQNGGRFSYTVDGHVFSFLSEDGYSERPRPRRGRAHGPAGWRFKPCGRHKRRPHGGAALGLAAHAAVGARPSIAPGRGMRRDGTQA